MDEIVHRDPTLTFNGPLETGVRAVAILGAAFPRSYDLHRLTALDYLLVHTHQLGGPDDLHPSTPIQTPATVVRSKIIQDALNMMMTKDLVRRVVSSTGIHYCAGEAAAMFLDALRSPYLVQLKSRANWLTYHLADHTDVALDDLMKRFFDRWIVEFQDVERSLGADR